MFRFFFFFFYFFLFHFFFFFFQSYFCVFLCLPQAQQLASTEQIMVLLFISLEAGPAVMFHLNSVAFDAACGLPRLFSSLISAYFCHCNLILLVPINKNCIFSWDDCEDDRQRTPR